MHLHFFTLPADTRLVASCFYNWGLVVFPSSSTRYQSLRRSVNRTGPIRFRSVHLKEAEDWVEKLKVPLRSVHRMPVHAFINNEAIMEAKVILHELCIIRQVSSLEILFVVSSLLNQPNTRKKLKNNQKIMVFGDIRATRDVSKEPSENALKKRVAQTQTLCTQCSVNCHGGSYFQENKNGIAHPEKYSIPVESHNVSTTKMRKDVNTTKMRTEALFNLRGEPTKIGFVFCQTCGADQVGVVPQMNGVNVVKITAPRLRMDRWVGCNECPAWHYIDMPWLFQGDFFCRYLSKECKRKSDE